MNKMGIRSCRVAVTFGVLVVFVDVVDVVVEAEEILETSLH